MNESDPEDEDTNTDFFEEIDKTKKSEMLNSTKKERPSKKRDSIDNLTTKMSRMSTKTDVVFKSIPFSMNFEYISLCITNLLRMKMNTFVSVIENGTKLQLKTECLIFSQHQKIIQGQHR